jgi:uncharacterized membrane protein YphA (DoxX/SURF4 family)
LIAEQRGPPDRQGTHRIIRELTGSSGNSQLNQQTDRNRALVPQRLNTVTVDAARRARWVSVRPWVGTLARLGLAAVWLVAGGAKVTDLAASGRAVNAYQVMSYDVARVIGAALPFVEIALGVLLLVGLATRLAGSIAAMLLVVFITGISSAWARGLSIDCGCFGSGGQLGAGQSPSYGPEVVRDLAFLALAAFLIRYPGTRLSLDSWLSGPEDEFDEPEDEPEHERADAVGKDAVSKPADSVGRQTQ